jgi:predicted nuclease of predicted toxin-antitoxin system
MKLLLDENLPKRLKDDFSEHDIYTVRDKGWDGKNNGDLMKLMIEDNFDVLLTFDKNLQHQQNFKKYNLAVLVLNASSNTYQNLKDLVPKIKEVLNGVLNPGGTEIKHF